MRPVCSVVHPAGHSVRAGVMSVVERVAAETSSAWEDYVMRELVKQKMEMERMATVMASQAADNVKMKAEMERLTTANVKLETETENMRQTLNQQADELDNLRRVRTSTSAGSSYIRWGRLSCEGNATLLYKGYAGGPLHTDRGTGSNYICLHERPQWSKYISGHQDSSRIYGVEYQMFEYNSVFSLANNDGQSLADHPAPCAVCYLPTRSTSLMMPARTECPAGWTMEYSGYIVADHHLNHRTSYICLDGAPETKTGASNQNQGVIYPVEVMCGSLPCYKFAHGRELTCVVCSK